MDTYIRICFGYRSVSKRCKTRDPFLSELCIPTHLIILEKRFYFSMNMVHAYLRNDSIIEHAFKKVSILLKGGFFGSGGLNGLHI